MDGPQPTVLRLSAAAPLYDIFWLPVALQTVGGDLLQLPKATVMVKVKAKAKKVKVKKIKMIKIA